MANGKPLGYMKAILDLDSSAFSKGLEGAKKSVAYNMKAMQSQMKVMNSSGDKLGALQTKYDGLSKTLSSNEKYMSKLKTQYDKSFDANGKATASTAKYANELNQAIAKSASYEAQMKTTTGQIARMKVETEGVTGKLKAQSDQWIKSGKKIESFGKKMSSIGSTLTMSVTAPIAAGFGLATKKAVDFQTQIGEIGPLLTNGGKMTTEYRNQLDQMSDSSKKWAKEYGVSTTEINTGLAEIVRKGYDANQTLGVMPSILDATKASGDDFNDVMNVTTEVISQFNLKGKDYNSTVKNATRVTDALTYVANATSAGFSDLGLAMGYVGPVANSLGMDVEETASAIGLLSDAGIGGEKAGTALRGALTRLLKPSKQNIAGFEKLGISVDEFKNGTLTLPDMLNKIKQNTEGWTDAQRTSAIALAFGTESQSAMNVLVGQGGDALKGLTKETYNANGATKEIAKSMNDLPANKVARFKESLNVLAITAGEKLLPVFTPILEKATQLINKFSELDDETQQNILKWGGLVASIGPALKILGPVAQAIGKTKTAVGLLSKGIVDLAAKAAEKKAIAGFSTTVASVGTASATAAGTSGVAGLGASIAGLAGPIGIGLVALGAVAGAVVVGKKAYDDYQLSGGKWGTEVTGTQDKVITKSNELKEKGVQYMNEYQDGVNTNAEKIKKANKGIQDAIEGTLEKEEQRREKITKLSFLDEETKAWYEQVIAAQKKVDEKTAETVKAQIDKINGIYKNASDNNRQLSDQEMQYIRSSYANLSDDQLKAAGFTKSQRLAIETAYQDDLSKLSEKEVSTRIKTLEKSLDKEKTSYDKQRKEIESNETLSSSVRKRLLNDLKENYKKSTSEMITALGNLTEKSGSSLDSVWFKWEKYGYNVEEVTALVSSSVKDTTKDLSLFAKGTSDADMQWNALSLDPKTGEVKTNMTDVLTEIAQTDDGWNQLKFMVKEAKLTSNAKEEVAIAMGEAGKWDQLWLTEKMLLVNGDEAKLELYETINAMGAWNQYVLDRKTLGIDNADAVYKLFTTQEQINQWNTLPVNQKKLLADNTDLTEKIFASNESYTAWTQVPDNVKYMLADNVDLKTKLTDGTISTEQYNQVLPLLKKMYGDNYDVTTKTAKAKNEIDDYNKNHHPEQKVLTGNNADVLNKEKTARDELNQYNGVQIPEKKMVAKDDVTPNAEKALGSYREVANLQDKTISFKLTAFFDDTWEKVKKAFNQKGNNLTGKYAKGTNYHLGGSAIVNDQRGSLYKELVIPKGGTPFIPQGRNVLLPDLKKGSKVLNASKTKQLIPRYAGGIGEVITQDSEITELIRAINELILTFKTMQPQSIDSNTVGTMTEKSVIPNTQGTTGMASITPDQLLAQGEEYTAIGTMWMTNLMNGWNSIVPTYMNSETIFISNYLTQLSNQNNPNYLQGITWNRNLMNGWNSLTGTFINLIKTFCNQAMTTLRSYNAPMYNNGRTWQQNNLNGWNSLYGSFIARVNQLGNDSISNLRSKNGGFYNAGRYLMQSLINGSNSMGGSLAVTMNGVSNKMTSGIGKGVNGVIAGVNHVMTQVEGKSLKPWTPPQYAKGTDGHPGGLAMINDQKGPVHEEYVQMPDGRGFIAKGKDLLVNLPKGAQVLNANLTKKLKDRTDIPRYEDGIGDFDVFDLIDDKKVFEKLVREKMNYAGISEPWLNMTKSSVKLMVDQAYGFVKKKAEEMFGGTGSRAEFMKLVLAQEGKQYVWGAEGPDTFDCSGLIMWALKQMGISFPHYTGAQWQSTDHISEKEAVPGDLIYFGPGASRHVGMYTKPGEMFNASSPNAYGPGNGIGYSSYAAPDLLGFARIRELDGHGGLTRSSGKTGIERWRTALIKALKMNGLPTTKSYVNAWMAQIDSESDGDEKAIGGNDGLADGNATGLLQTKPGTFAANAFPGHGNIMNGFDNMLAAIRYAKNRYGANMLGVIGRGHGYENGGLINKDGLYRAGEGNKPEMVIPLTRKTRAIELMGQALAFLSGDNKKTSKQSAGVDNTEELVALIKQQQKQHSDLMRILRAILNKESGITKESIGRAANDLMGNDLNKLGYTIGDGF
ncbi:phage tail tape measure protein, TP901 family, core region [Enterococcus malodoratus]|uniref:phage tail tape measure protein n=1 Tax=Enterococcus malodoratus TaxID=71451 RepID=UPI0008C3D663|nr:phage tail tape measure protein [Enterococcus malodoratus]SET96548.1 phage tail tape measure protein, TP901 family, core region [Enterococcus malodoratus]